MNETEQDSLKSTRIAEPPKQETKA